MHLAQCRAQRQLLDVILTAIRVQCNFISTLVLLGLHYYPTRRLTGFRDKIFGSRSGLEWPKARTLTTPGAGEEAEHLELTAGWGAECAATVPVRWAVSYRTRHAFTIGPSICTPWCLPKGVKNRSTQNTAHGC